MAVSEPSRPRTPDPLREEPPADRFCDLILNGGVASGVVYPWALLELARHYRFRNIGGNSAGAIAAALAAAAEYGRCRGVANAFEPLRRTPADLAEERGGRTKLLRLFQPASNLVQMFELFLRLVEDPADTTVPKERRNPSKLRAAGLFLLRAYAARTLPLLALLGVGIVWYTLLHLGFGAAVVALLLAGLSSVLVVALQIGVGLYRSLQEVARNGYGLCTGSSQNAGEEGLVEWLHRGVQLSAGRGRDDPPLTFADLWAAPRFGRVGPLPRDGGLQPDGAGITLQMFASNVTLGRPVRLPLNDPVTRLFYLPEQWAACFPSYLMTALEKASSEYVMKRPGDPDPDSRVDDEQVALMRDLRELPGGDMPIVVATRLSLCFPFLFSFMPVYAIDDEVPDQPRKLRQCLLSDGGLCTNFPIHLFDAAHPRWPTFGFLLDKRLKRTPDTSMTLPVNSTDGASDNWQTDVPEWVAPGHPVPTLLDWLSGLLGGMLGTTKDWNDRVTTRLPQVRNRVVRLALRPGEGQLNLRMPKDTILRMAEEYGTGAGALLVEAFAPDGNGIKPAWREHLFVRSRIELRALLRHLAGYTVSVRDGGTTVPLAALFRSAVRSGSARDADGGRDAADVTAPQQEALERAVRSVEALEAQLAAVDADCGAYRPVPEPELRLRPPM